MQKIPLKLATSGMVLARDIFRNGNSATGFPVCGKGTELTDTLITRLENMDIPAIYVEGRPLWEEGDQSLEDVMRDLKQRFSKVGQDPLMQKLFEIYADHYKRSMGEDGA